MSVHASLLQRSLSQESMDGVAGQTRRARSSVAIMNRLLQRISKMDSASDQILTCEMGYGLSFCHEEAAEVVDRRAVGVDCALVSSRPKQRAKKTRSATSTEPRLSGRYPLDFTDGGRMAISAGRISLPFNLLAATAMLARKRDLAGRLAHAAGSTG